MSMVVWLAEPMRSRSRSGSKPSLIAFCARRLGLAGAAAGGAG